MDRRIGQIASAGATRLPETNANARGRRLVLPPSTVPPLETFET
jgi:hypothetical protein